MKFLIIFSVLIVLASCATTRPNFGKNVVPSTYRAARPPIAAQNSYKPPSPVVAAYKKPSVVTSNDDATIVSRSFTNDGHNYQFEFETSDGIKRSETGEQKKIGDSEGMVVRGEYSYIEPDGTVVRVTYIADENGFQPTIHK